MPSRPNVLFILADQLRAASLPLYGETQIETPAIDRLAAAGSHFTNAIASCPVCTPYRSMLLTGRHPQTTGHVINFVRTRHDEISVGDAFGRAGYRTGWVGKWHLHTGSFPQVEGQDYVPEGRDRLGFQHWRGYNFHTQYFDGWVNVGDWRNERWEGYETDALARYAVEFMDATDGPFCLFVSPHQPHGTGGRFAPDRFYERLPERLTLPDNVPESRLAPHEGAGNWMLSAPDMYRHYLAMTLAVDEMVGRLLDHLDRTGRAEDTLVVFGSDHGTQVGAHDLGVWDKKLPYEESLRVPLVARWPGVIAPGARREALVAPVDIFPTLCGLAGLPVPRSVEGFDLSAAWRGEPGAFEQDAVLTMNFTASHDYLKDGQEWRGLRAREWAYTRWLDGRTELYDLRTDPLQMHNLADEPAAASTCAAMGEQLRTLMARRSDELVPCHTYANWFDPQRRVVRNGYGPLGDPEAAPDWSLLDQPPQGTAS